jgi:HSP20 family protein
MNPYDEKFFEELSQSRAPKPPEPMVIPVAENFEVELASSKTAAAPRISKKAELSKPEFEGTLTLDVYQTPSEIVIESAIAGIKPEDLDITATNELVTIRGERKKESRISEEDYFYQECYWGRFSRSVILPQEVDPEGANVSYKNGVLTVRLPKVVRNKSKRLNVRID